jgi:hypothetical protein
VLIAIIPPTGPFRVYERVDGEAGIPNGGAASHQRRNNTLPDHVVEAADLQACPWGLMTARAVPSCGRRPDAYISSLSDQLLTLFNKRPEPLRKYKPLVLALGRCSSLLLSFRTVGRLVLRSRILVPVTMPLTLYATLAAWFAFVAFDMPSPVKKVRPASTYRQLYALASDATCANFGHHGSCGFWPVA